MRDGACFARARRVRWRAAGSRRGGRFDSPWGPCRRGPPVREGALAGRPGRGRGGERRERRDARERRAWLGAAHRRCGGRRAHPADERGRATRCRRAQGGPPRQRGCGDARGPAGPQARVRDHQRGRGQSVRSSARGDAVVAGTVGLRGTAHGPARRRRGRVHPGRGARARRWPYVAAGCGAPGGVWRRVGGLCDTGC